MKKQKAMFITYKNGEVQVFNVDENAYLYVLEKFEEDRFESVMFKNDSNVVYLIHFNNVDEITYKEGEFNE